MNPEKVKVYSYAIHQNVVSSHSYCTLSRIGAVRFIQDQM